MWSLGKLARSTIRTRYPLRARSMAVGDPAQRPPTTIASYFFAIRPSPSTATTRMRSAAPCEHRGPPLFRCWLSLRAYCIGCGLSPASQLQLREDVPDVVLDGLAADEKPIADLGIG